MSTQTIELDNSCGTTTPERVLHAFLDAWWNGDVVEASDRFSDRFTFTDHALGLEFKDKSHLTAYLAKTREFFPDTHGQTKRYV